MSKNKEINAEAVTEETNITVYDVSKIGVLNGQVTEIHVVNLDANKKKLANQRCEVTGKSARYLYAVKRGDGETKKVAASVLKSAGVTGKEIDKMYGVAWSATHSGTGSAKLSTEDQAAQLKEFIGA